MANDRKVNSYRREERSADSPASLQVRLNNMSKEVAAGRKKRVHVDVQVDDFAFEYFVGLSASLLRLPRTEALNAPTLRDWMLYAEVLVSYRITHVHLPEVNAGFHRTCRVPDFFYLALAQIGRAQALGYEVVPVFRPRYFAESTLTVSTTTMVGSLSYVDPTNAMEVNTDELMQIQVDRTSVYERESTVAGFVMEMSRFLDSISRRGYGVIEGVPPAVEGDFDTMLFMHAVERGSSPALLHFSGDVEPGKAVLSAFFNLLRTREILNPVIPYSATMYGTGGFDLLLRAMAQPG